MRKASSKLIELLNLDQFLMADLYTFVTVQGDVYCYTNYDYDLTVDGVIYKADGPIIEREGITTSLSLEVDNLELNISVTPDTTFNDIPIAWAFHNGTLDGGRFILERLFLDINKPLDTSAGTVKLFDGRLIEPEIIRNKIQVSVASDTDVLDVQMPRELYQAGCLNTLFDSSCGLKAQEFMLTSTVQTGTTTSKILCELNKPQGWFTQGVVEFTQGVNKGLKRTVRIHETGIILLTLPLLETPQVGETIKVYPGCDKLLETCGNRFKNTEQFRGFPFIPVPETAV